MSTWSVPDQSRVTIEWPAAARPANSGLGAALTIGLFVATLAGVSSTTSIPIDQAQVRYLAPGAMTAVVLDAPVHIDTAMVAERTRRRLNDRLNVWHGDLPATVAWLHENSGLTWDQLGRALGVSRRAVHLWAGGGRMNATNVENLNELVSIVRELPGTSSTANRSALLAPSRRGPSIFDEFRDRVQRARTNISGTPWQPQQLVGALHDEVSQET